MVSKMDTILRILIDSLWVGFRFLFCLISLAPEIAFLFFTEIAFGLAGLRGGILRKRHIVVFGNRFTLATSTSARGTCLSFRVDCLVDFLAAG